MRRWQKHSTLRMKRGLALLTVMLACSSGTPPSSNASASSASGAAAARAETMAYDIVFGGRVAGRVSIVWHADGSADEHLAFDDRGSGPETHARLELGADGLPDRFELSGHDYRKRKVHEQLACSAARCRWQGEDEQGEGPRGFYIPSNPSLSTGRAVLARALAPEGVPLLPGGTLRAVAVAGARLTRGDEQVALRAIEFSGSSFEPWIEWYDGDGVPFAQVDDFGAAIREGWQTSIPELLALQRPLAQHRRERIARETSRRLERFAIVHARLFDPLRRTIVDDATIVVRGDRIEAVGTALPAPEGAPLIDAAGMTALPGLWDMHAHVRDEDGLLHLANGVTTVRDLGSETLSAVARRTRWAAGSELGPRLLLAGFVDGHGPEQGPFEVFADTPEQARTVVDAYASRGYVQLKIYGSMKPELVPLIVERAREKRLRVSGHIPRRLTASDVVRLGYDEIQHVEQLMMDLVSTSPDEARSAVKVAERAAALDLDGPRATALIDLLAKEQIVVDPTLNVVEAELLTRRDRPSPTLAPLLGRLPVQVRRRAVLGALPVADGMGPTYERSFGKYLQFVERLWERQVPLVAGTDAWPGFALQRELELYSQAGIPNADVLALATLGAARVMHLDERSGSIAPGKDADLILVAGDPLARMSDIREVATVILAGRIVDAGALQRALSMAPAERRRREE